MTLAGGKKIWVLGEALMDCVAQPDGSLRPFMGGSPFNLARAAALRMGGNPLAQPGNQVGFINPFSTDRFGDQMLAQLAQDGVQPLTLPSRLPTSLAVVQISNGQPSYGFYREGIADRDYTPDAVLSLLKTQQPGILHTGSLLLVPPEHDKVLTVLKGAKALGWTISIDVNLRPKLAADLQAYVAAVLQVAALADWIKASDEDLALLGLMAPDNTLVLEQKAATMPDRQAVIATKFITNGATRVALTFGADGAWLQVDGHIAQQQVPKIAVVDTVGAGDTFWGNCLADWAMQPANPGQRVAKTLRDAMQAAAINCSRAGCQPPQFGEL